MKSLTQILSATQNGEPRAAEQLRPLMYEELRKLAVRHGGGLERVDVDATGVEIAAPQGGDDKLLAVHDVIDRLAAVKPRKAELVKLHDFVGLTSEESADALGISAPTAQRDWAYARAGLKCEIRATRG